MLAMNSAIAQVDGEMCADTSGCASGRMRRRGGCVCVCVRVCVARSVVTHTFTS